MPKKLIAAQDFGSDDFQDITKNIYDLGQIYITPINQFRSRAKVEGVDANNIEGSMSNLQPDGLRYMESRAHAFYRMIGFPVATKNSFYNPGFNPKGNRQRSTQIASNFLSNNSLMGIINKRELNFFQMERIFLGQGLSSSLFSLITRYTRKFQVMDENLDSLDPDKQSGKVEARKKAIEKFTEQNSGLKENINTIKSSLFGSTGLSFIGSDLNGWQHILKPFVVNPMVDLTVQPANRQICVPFLANKASETRLGPNKKDILYRPELEYIIRERLSSQTLDSNFLQNLIDIFKNKQDITRDLSSKDIGPLSATVIALADENDVSNINIKEIFEEATNIQITKITECVKLMKVAITGLNQAIQTIDRARKDINWLPVTSEEGPELIRGSFFDEYGSANLSEIEKQIAEIRSKIQVASNREPLFNNDIRFPISKSNSAQKNLQLYNAKIKTLENERNDISTEAFQALRTIELVTGEVSGLGLIDIFAINGALWALDETSLINLLDDDAFDRMLANNSGAGDTAELWSVAVEFRQAGVTQNIEETLNNFQKKVINFLSFADVLMDDARKSPLNRRGGTIDS